MADFISLYIALDHIWRGERALHGASGLAALDIIASAVGVGGVVELLFFDYDLADAPPDYPRPWRRYEQPVWITLLLVM